MTIRATFKAAIFDMDGLLIDSERAIMRAWIAGARELGLGLAEEDFVQCIGRAAPESDAILTGHRTERLPNNASFCFTGTQGESLIVALDLAGFATSSGSACTSGDTEPSYVLLALGLERHIAQGSLRLTVGRATTDADVDALLAALPPIVARLREASAVSV